MFFVVICVGKQHYNWGEAPNLFSHIFHSGRIFGSGIRCSDHHCIAGMNSNPRRNVYEPLLWVGRGHKLFPLIREQW